MCTLTIIPHAAGIRAVCSRDERRTRPTALPPVHRACGELTALMPIDPPSDSTWISVNSAGLIFALLNANPRSQAGAAPIKPLRSRGDVIRSLIGIDNFKDAVHASLQLPAEEFSPFRLIIADLSLGAEIYCNGSDIRLQSGWRASEAKFFTSSGLGDDLVNTPRRQLFNKMMTAGDAAAAQQDRFHEHRWHLRPHLSIYMERADARTVSWTTIELHPTCALMTYRDVDSPCVSHRATLAIRIHQTT